MTNIREAESAFLEAKAEFEEWKAEFIAGWYRPQQGLLLNMLARELINLPPVMKEQLKKQNPDGWKQVEKVAAGKVKF